MKIMKAEKSDLKDILELQYMAYQSEAILTNNFEIPPLKQTYDEILTEYDSCDILKAVDKDGNIIGSVRGRLKDNILQVARLMVHPRNQGQGIGTKLIAAIEELYPGVRKELFTSERSTRNIQLYQRNGYQIFKTENLTENLKMVYLYKQ